MKSRIIKTLALLICLYATQASAQETKEYSGVLLSQDLSLMALDGPGKFTVKTDNEKTLHVNLTSGESNCDRTAITIPHLRVGDKVKVKGTEYKGLISICTAGTYIK